MSLKLKVLTALVAQTTLQSLLLGYSRKNLKQKYNASTAIFVQEFIKVLVSLLLMNQRARSRPRNDSLDDSQIIVTVDNEGHKSPRLSFSKAEKPPEKDRIWYLVQTSLPMSVPAIIYYVQNVLVYIALTHLQPQVYSTLIQFKLVTAALVSMALLGRKFSLKKWRALLILTTGAILVQSKSVLCETQKNAPADANPILGTMVTLSVSVLSSLAGVYTEMVLNSQGGVSLWGRNFQLGIYSMGFALIKIIWDGDLIDFFDGYSWITWFVILSEALRGLTVALVLKHADTVLKGFATSCSIILTTILSVFLLGNSVDTNFAMGASNVILSIFMYNE
jgi:UDP-sugar transporter A1/2/3